MNFLLKFFMKLCGSTIKQVKCTRCRKVATIPVPKPITTDECKKIRRELPSVFTRWTLTDEKRFYCPTCEPL